MATPRGDLTSSVDNGSTASYVYNALGERVEKDLSGTYTEYAFDKDGNPEAENDRGSSNGGWVDSWVNFEGQHIAHYENNGVYYIYSNQVGTAAVATDWTGAVLQDELHYPWGKVWTTMGTQTEERFASLHHRDAATNLDPTHFRMYSSDEARWLTPDPAQADIFHPQSMSRYAYADLNPLRLVDPLGSVTNACNETRYGYTISYCTAVTAPQYDPPLNPFATAVGIQLYQNASFLESGSFYGEWYGLSALGGASAAVQMQGGLTVVGQAVSAWGETNFPGSVQAATEFVSGLAGNAEFTVAGALGALTSQASSIVDEGENVGSDVWGWFKHLLC